MYEGLGCTFKKNISTSLSFIGRSIVSDSWKFGAPCHDGESAWPVASAHVEESRVSDCTSKQKLVVSSEVGQREWWFLLFQPSCWQVC